MISGIYGHVDNSRRLLLTNQQCKSNKSGYYRRNCMLVSLSIIC